MLSPTNKNNIRRVFFSYFLVRICALVVAVALIFTYFHSQSLIDWWRLRGYTPPAAISSFVHEDSMTPYTAHLFYLNRPQLLSTVSSFRTNCPENKDTIVLGCYHPDQNGIYIYNVPDPTLSGVQQVTAAHEVLHAVYARLSGSERTTLDNELQDYYKHGLHNSVVSEEITLYQQTEPNDVFDEMSCTFGTEVPQLPSALENYYKKYFTNRSVIVAFEQQYETAFSSRKAIIKQDDAQLTQMKAQIDTDQTDLKSKLDQINTQNATLSTLRSSGNTAAYNAGVAPYNALIDSYNSEINNLTALINQYNQLVSARNTVAGEYTTLTTAIDTRITPVKQTSN